MRRAKVEAAVVDRLLSGARPVGDVVVEVSAALTVSVQGVYKAIRKLRAEEIVTVHNKQIALSGVWIAKEKARLQFAEDAYRSAAELRALIEQESGKVRSVFKTLGEVDLYWTHAYFQLATRVDPTVPTYSIQPHDWYPYVREETDTHWIKQHREAGRVSRTLITHPGPLDHKVMRERKRELGALFEFTLGENPFRQDSATYYSLLAPYIITVQFAPAVAAALDEFIASHDTLPLSADASKEIGAIIQTSGRFVFTIEKSEKKAAQMEQKVKKYFVFG